MMIVGSLLAGRGFDRRWFSGFYPHVALLAGVVLSTEGRQAIIQLSYFK